MRTKSNLIKAVLAITTIVAILQIAELDVQKLRGLVNTNFDALANQYLGWGLLALLAIYFYYIEKRHENIPITVKDCKICIHYNDDQGKSVLVTYKKKLRANHEDVDAMFLSQTPSGNGKIKRDSIRAVINAKDFSANQNTEIHAKGNGWEIVQKLDRPLPRDFPIIPYLRMQNIEYECSAEYLDSFLETDTYEYYEFIIDHRIGFKQVSFELEVPEAMALDCKLHQMVTHSVKEFPVMASNSERKGFVKHCISSSVPQKQAIRYRLVWKKT